MTRRTYYAAVFGELEQAYNADDPLGAVRCFAFPAVVRTKQGVQTFDMPVDLAVFFRQRMELNRSRGVQKYAFALGKVVTAGPVGIADVTWHRIGHDSYASSHIWYTLAETDHGWRIEGVCNRQRGAQLDNRAPTAVAAA